MYGVLKGHTFENEIQTITQIFFPNEKFIRLESPPPSGVAAVSEAADGTCRNRLFVDGSAVAEDTVYFAGDEFKEQKRKIKLSMFDLLKAYTGLDTPWGALTGIRPSKIARLLLDEGRSREETARIMLEKYRTEDEKARLAISVADVERKLLTRCAPNGAHIYIGIPFCPSRCLYCSFTSFPIARHDSLIDPYLRCLVMEMERFRDYFKDKRLETVYIGGGTPTSLDESRLDFLLRSVHGLFDMKNCREFTVEAGRPDTLDAGKLRLLKAYHVDRLSLNPQTMNDLTLQKIGRAHTVADFIKGFQLARDAGHDNINTDVILGLPGETTKDVEHTMRELTALDPDNITVHTLAVKRASRLRESMEEYPLTAAQEMEHMLRVSRDGCRAAGLSPYYMYRQKNMIGNYENIGYSAPKKESLYNIVMMEETQSVVAFGAAGVTKLVNHGGEKIERVFNVKNIDDYINRIDEMIERKIGGLSC